MAIEIRKIDGENVRFDPVLGGAVLEYKDPERVASGLKATKPRRESQKKTTATATSGDDTASAGSEGDNAAATATLPDER